MTPLNTIEAALNKMRDRRERDIVNVEGEFGYHREHATLEAALRIAIEALDRYTGGSLNRDTPAHSALACIAKLLGKKGE